MSNARTSVLLRQSGEEIVELCRLNLLGNECTQLSFWRSLIERDFGSPLPATVSHDTARAMRLYVDLTRQTAQIDESTARSPVLRLNRLIGLAVTSGYPAMLSAILLEHAAVKTLLNIVVRTTSPTYGEDVLAVVYAMTDALRRRDAARLGETLYYNRSQRWITASVLYSTLTKDPSNPLIDMLIDPFGVLLDFTHPAVIDEPLQFESDAVACYGALKYEARGALILSDDQRRRLLASAARAGLLVR